MKTYKKDNSFVAMNKASADEKSVRARIKKVWASLKKESKKDDRWAIIDQACQDLFNPAALPEGQTHFTLREYVVEEMSRLPDDQLARYLFYRYRYEIFPERKLLDSYPPLLQIEPTSICNYRCVFCYQTDKPFTETKNGHMGMMSLDLFKRIIDGAEGHCDGVTLASRGEPLICKDIVPMLEYIRGKFVGLKMNTNASLLDEAKSHAILESGMNTLVFSIDAADAKTYSELRVGGQLDRVLKNIRQFQEIRQKHYPDSKLLTRVSGVKVPGTPSFERMQEYWGGLVDQVAFVTYNPWENVYESPVNDLTTPCSDLWRRMFIWWDGKANPCDVDYRSALSVGRLEKESLSSLWRSPAYEALRTKHLLKNRSQCQPCQRCVVI